MLERYDAKYEKEIDIHPKQYKMTLRFIDDEFADMCDDHRQITEIIIRILKVPQSFQDSHNWTMNA